MTPVKASAPICCRPLKPSSPTSVPVKKAIETTTKNMPPPTTSAPEPEGDVRHQDEDLFGVAQRAGQRAQDAHVELQLVVEDVEDRR